MQKIKVSLRRIEAEINSRKIQKKLDVIALFARERELLCLWLKMKILRL